MVPTSQFYAGPQGSPVSRDVPDAPLPASSVEEPSSARLSSLGPCGRRNPDGFKSRHLLPSQ